MENTAETSLSQLIEQAARAARTKVDQDSSASTNKVLEGFEQAFATEFEKIIDRPGRRARHAQNHRARLREARVKKDGRWFNPLLGTDGHMGHGTYHGYTRYGCQCDDCRAANAETHRKYQGTQEAMLRAEIGDAVLTERWPKGKPDDEQLAEVRQAVVARWAKTKTPSARVEMVAAELERFPVWERATRHWRYVTAQQLVELLATTSRRYNPPQ